MIYIVVALSAEARPLCAHFQLDRVEALQPLSVFRRADQALIVSGVGRERAASAVESLAKAIRIDIEGVIGAFSHYYSKRAGLHCKTTLSDAYSREPKKKFPLIIDGGPCSRADFAACRWRGPRGLTT